MNNITIRRFVPVIAGHVSIPDKQITRRNVLDGSDVINGSVISSSMSLQNFDIGDMAISYIYPEDVDSGNIPDDVYGELRDAADLSVDDSESGY